MTEATNQAEAMNELTRQAQKDTILTPRFYTTNFDEIDRIDVTPVRQEWDELIAEMKSDPNRSHFIRNEEFNRRHVCVTRGTEERSLKISSSVP